MTYDAIVIGLGAMGSAAAAHVARRGASVVGLEQFHAVHALGSSHGKSRIIRQAYYEDPAYVPLVLRAYELWRELETVTGATLLQRTGGIMVGTAEGELVRGSLRSAREHGLEHELLDAAELRKRFPATTPRAEEVGVFERPAGILFPEECVRAHLLAASAAGADLRFETPVTCWQRTAGGGVRVDTAAGDTIEARSAVVCGGAWLAKLVPGLRVSLRVERNVMHWFAPRSHPELLGADRLPIFMLQRAEQPLFYGFPNIRGQGVKAAFHHSGEYSEPHLLRREVGDAEIETARTALSAWLPDAAGSHVDSVACMYTLTPDEHFLIGVLADHPQVVIAGGFSGHGFKFSSVVGEIAADLALQGSTRHRIDRFALRRFA
ncbi:MAG: N-methyl-L-tryptophan oxidase [Candidatus Eremiobacter antarcticus]|nr:N-methyl-L-tryptophan oxidase [Candidatus Eremiobacteraeota bacterium]MBC5807933.1 N-methyl-L-tryptophan oxidase [Candidatus Eremiobacteraeota bacterium]PZR62699.1 MAG: N-methyl-L-tryptophan oxidase [Candidatus Eremiobacter sp. RRmetagenome_bin22]